MPSPKFSAIAFTVVILSAAFAGPVSGSTVEWKHDPASTGAWEDPANWDIRVPVSDDDARIKNGGTAQISTSVGTIYALYVGDGTGKNGALVMNGGSITISASAYLGNNWAAGRFAQTGGTFTTKSDLYVGNSAGAGTYQLEGSGYLSTNNLRIGNKGLGTVTQTGGTCAIKTTLYVSNTTGSYSYESGIGTYLLGGTGKLSATTEYVGYGDTGLFSQTNGVNTVSGTLYVGYRANKTGTYRLSSGGLSAANEILGQKGSGVFEQTGGVNTAGNLTVHSTSRYTLSAGTLSVTQREDLSGQFVQSGGSHTVGYLASVAGSQYTLSGGTLRVTNGADVRGTMAFAGGTGAAYLGGGLVNLGQSTLTGTSLAYLEIGTNSLAIFPTGFDPAANFGTFVNNGVVHNRGTTLVVPAGKSFTIEGTIDDRVECQGTVNAVSGKALNLANGVLVSASGTVNLDQGTLTVNDLTSGVSNSALLAAKTINIGYSTKGKVAQSGGTNTVTTLNIATGVSSTGTYQMTGGRLNATNVHVGQNQEATGSFVQSGGTLSVSGVLMVGYGYIGTGSYSLSNGYASAASLVVGGNRRGIGNFTQTGGTLRVTGDLAIGKNTYGNNEVPRGVYSLKGGHLSVGGNIVVGTSGVGVGRLELLGGSLSAAGVKLAPAEQGVLALGIPFSMSDLLAGFLPGGIPLTGLSNSTLEICNGQTLVQDSGSFSIARNLRIGGPAGGANYTLCGTGHLIGGESLYIGYKGGNCIFTLRDSAKLTSDNGIFIGEEGKGTFIQESGTVSTAASVIVGRGTGGDGTYALKGSGYLNTGSSTIIGYSAIPGLFIQEGGTHASTKVYVGGWSSVSLGTYRMLDGECLTTELRLGDPNSPAGPGFPGSRGVFEQSGGTVTAEYMEITPVSRYVYSGGRLQSDSLVVNGTLDFAGRDVTLTLGSGMADFSNGKFDNTSNGTLVVGPDSLMFVASGFDPNAAFADFSTEGVVHVRGTTLVVPAGHGFKVTGEISDRVECAGSISALPGKMLRLTNGLFVSNGGTVNMGSLSNSYILVNDQTSGMSGGLITGKGPRVGYYGTGRFVQTGGDICGATMGMFGGDVGTYELSGTGIVRGIGAGWEGKGVFIQTGGTVLGGVYLGYYGPESEGVCLMSGGLIKGDMVKLGGSTGRFVQTGGEVDVSDIQFYGSKSTYELGGTGKVKISRDLVVNTPCGFTQTAGTCAIGETLNIYGDYGGEVAYALSDGLLTAGDAVIQGHMRQTGGTVQIASLTNLSAEYWTALYELSGGTLSTPSLWLARGSQEDDKAKFIMSGDAVLATDSLYVGQHGTGTFIQNGGVHQGKDIIVWEGAEYDLNQGRLSLSTADIKGTFAQSGGTCTAFEKIYVNKDKEWIVGTYNLSGGLLEATTEIVSRRISWADTRSTSGRFFQSGGRNVVDYLEIGLKGRYEYSGGELEIGKGMTVEGEFVFVNPLTLVVEDGAYANFSKGTLVNPGNAFIVAGANALLSFPSGFDPLTDLGGLLTDGLVHVAGQALTIPQGTVICNSGAFSGWLINEGELNPGHSPGILEVEGDFTQTSDGKLVIELAGKDNESDPSNPQFDQLLVSELADLAGTLELVLLDGYKPSLGDTFDILFYDSRDGAFQDVLGRLIDGELKFDLLYGTNKLTLTVAEVPEPVSLLLLAVGGMLMACRRKTRRASSRRA